MISIIKALNSIAVSKGGGVLEVWNDVGGREGGGGFQRGAVPFLLCTQNVPCAQPEANCIRCVTNLTLSACAKRI